MLHFLNSSVSHLSFVGVLTLTNTEDISIFINLEETNPAWIITGSACKKFLLSALAPQNSLRNLVVTFLSLSLICYENDVTFFKSSSVKNMGIFS